MEKSKDSEIKLTIGNYALERIDEDQVYIVEYKKGKRSSVLPSEGPPEDKKELSPENGVNERLTIEKAIVPDPDVIETGDNNDNQCNTPPPITQIRPDVSELTGDDDISVASMSSFSVRSFHDLRHPNYHESLLHNPASETPRVMFIPSQPLTNRGQGQPSETNVSDGSAATVSTPSWSGPRHPSIQETDMESAVIFATLVESSDQPVEPNAAQDDDLEGDNTQVQAVVIGTEVKSNMSCGKSRRMIPILITITAILITAASLIFVYVAPWKEETPSNPLEIVPPTQEYDVDDNLKGGPSIRKWNELKENLKKYNSYLIGPVIDNEYLAICETTDNNPYTIAAEPICLQFSECRYKFCMPELNAGSNLPTFVADVRSEEAIEHSIKFAIDNKLNVSVKTTGWSYTGSASSYGSLMLLMANFPKDGKVHQNYIDSCGSSHDAAVAVSGGETVDDVLEGLGDSYSATFTPFTRSIGAAGGYLQGGGTSFHSRTHGLAVDQVIDFRVVLGTGETVIADKCTNSDLFWSLKGGGGGTFGVVTKVHYKLQPKAPFVELTFYFYGQKNAYEDGQSDKFTTAISQWIEFWIEKSPYLDNRWNGIFGPSFCNLYFFGSVEDADFINEFHDWYDNVLKIPRSGSEWGAMRPIIKEHPSWFFYRGGHGAYRNPFYAAETLFLDQRNITSRLVPRDYVINKPKEVLDFMMDISHNGTIWTAPNFLLGGKINEVSTRDSSVHPILRKSVWSFFMFNPEGQKKLRDHFDKFEESAVLFNLHSVAEQNWTSKQWGSNYAQLFEKKKKYDPYSIFDCFHCVGNVADDLPYNY